MTRHVATPSALCGRITDYLCTGGLFNPELMDHQKVSDLLIDCRDAMALLDLKPKEQF